jgi:hypothetical protein
MIVFLKGYVTVAQPLGSLVNKLDQRLVEQSIQVVVPLKKQWI